MDNKGIRTLGRVSNTSLQKLQFVAAIIALRGDMGCKLLRGCPNESINPDLGLRQRKQLQNCFKQSIIYLERHPNPSVAQLKEVSLIFLLWLSFPWVLEPVFQPLVV